MSTAAFVKRHPLSMYFVLTFVISWGALLIMITASGIPTSKAQLDAQLPLAILSMLGGPSVAGLLLTGAVYGRPGFRDLLSRLVRWRVGIQWYAGALFTGPLVLLVVLMHASLTAATLILGPLAISGVSLLIYGLVLAIAMWLLAAAWSSLADRA